MMHSAEPAVSSDREHLLQCLETLAAQADGGAQTDLYYHARELSETVAEKQGIYVSSLPYLVRNRRFAQAHELVRDLS